MNSLRHVKELLGVLVKDSRRYRRALTGYAVAANGDPLWVHLCNRSERLEQNPAGRGVRCGWQWTSDLHACHFRTRYALRLAQLAFRDWPVRFADQAQLAEPPEVSFIIAHEGTQRLDHVWWTVRSILAQQGVAVECIVVDQTQRPSFSDVLPPAVRVVHRPLPGGLTGWRKSWAFNQGAREAQGRVLIFHDGDIVCPSGYAQAVTDCLGQYGAASIQRFLFNLNRTATLKLFETRCWPEKIHPERIRQNWEGGTIAVKRDAFFKLGGYDEAFVGWGGEDNEFFDRCSDAGHLRYGYLPFVHLWHAPQSDKHVVDNANLTTALAARLKIPRSQRVAELNRRDFGCPLRPHPETGYRDSMNFDCDG